MILRGNGTAVRALIAKPIFWIRWFEISWAKNTKIYWNSLTNLNSHFWHMKPTPHDVKFKELLFSFEFLLLKNGALFSRAISLGSRFDIFSDRPEMCKISSFAEFRALPSLRINHGWETWFVLPSPRDFICRLKTNFYSFLRGLLEKLRSRDKHSNECFLSDLNEAMKMSTSLCCSKKLFCFCQTNDNIAFIFLGFKVSESREAKAAILGGEKRLFRGRPRPS